MNRLLPSGQTQTEEDSPVRWSAGESQRSSGSRLRKALLGLGALALTYTAVRRMRSKGTAPGDRLEQSAGDAGPGDVRPGEGRTSYSGMAGEEKDSEAGEPARPQAGEQTAGGTEGEINQGDDEAMPGQDLSQEELEERGEEDASEVPAEPGEMEVDEEIVEDIVDEEAESEGENEERS